MRILSINVSKSNQKQVTLNEITNINMLINRCLTLMRRLKNRILVWVYFENLVMIDLINCF